MEIDKRENIRHWWVFLLRAILFVLLGIYMIATPFRSYVALSFLFGVIILIAGVFELIHAWNNRHARGWGWRLLVGIIDLVLGIIFVSNLAVSMSVLPILLGIWFLFRGFSLFSFASVVRRSLWLIIGGILSVIFALIIIFNPAVGAITIVIWIAIAFISIGVFNGILAFRLKAANDLLNP